MGVQGTAAHKKMFVVKFKSRAELQDRVEKPLLAGQGRNSRPGRKFKPGDPGRGNGIRDLTPGNGFRGQKRAAAPRSR